MPEKDEYFLIPEVRILAEKAGGEMPAAALTNNFLMVQAPGFIRGINPKSKIENPHAPAFIRGINPKSKIENPHAPAFIRGVNLKSKI
jgi:hypothetical protein